jgi:uncharacterized protein YidB (DUF937 family)
VAGYRPADYLDQYGRRERQEQPPASLWDALAAYATSPADLVSIGLAAAARYLYRYAATFLTRGAAAGNASAAAWLLQLLKQVRSDSVTDAAQWAATHASLDDPDGVRDLLASLRKAGASEQVATLLARDPFVKVSIEDPEVVGWLLHNLREAGADEQVATLLARDPAAHASLEDPEGVARLLDSLREAGADEQVATLLARDPAAHASLDNSYFVARLLHSLLEAGASEQVATLLARDPAAHASLDNALGGFSLRGALWEAGADEQAATLAVRLQSASVFLHGEEQGDTDRFRFGREADGTPAAPWDWDDLR